MNDPSVWRQWWQLIYLKNQDRWLYISRINKSFLCCVMAIEVQHIYFKAYSVHTGSFYLNLQINLDLWNSPSICIYSGSEIQTWLWQMLDWYNQPTSLCISEQENSNKTAWDFRNDYIVSKIIPHFDKKTGSIYNISAYCSSEL